MLEYMRDTMKKLDRVSLSEATIDLEDVRFLMNVMKQIRERESIIEFQLRPIEEMYIMLKRNDVRVPKQQMEDVSDLRQSWAKVPAHSGCCARRQRGLLNGFARSFMIPRAFALPGPQGCCRESRAVG